MSTLYRAQVVLEAEQHRTLTEIAEREGRSLSDLVRGIVREYLVAQDEEARLQREMEGAAGTLDAARCLRPGLMDRVRSATVSVDTDPSPRYDAVSRPISARGPSRVTVARLPNADF